MSFKYLADTFSVARDSDHFIQLKSLKKPRVEDQIWLAFEIIGDTKFARSTVQNIIDTIEEVYFENLELDAYERFENALKEINIIYKNMKEKRGVKSLGTISAIIAIFSGNELHLTQSKDAEAYLIRKGKLSLVSEGLSGKSEDLFVNIASGEILPEDKVLFCTSRLLRLATHSQIAGLCDDGVTEALDSIRELVLSDNDLSIGVTCVHAKLPQRGVAKSNFGGNKYLNKIKEVLSSAFEFIGKKLGGKINNKIGVNTDFNKNTILAIILVIILILIISISFLMDGRRNGALREEYRIRIEGMHQDINTANTKGYANDKETANAILEKVEAEAREILETNYFRAETLALVEKIQETRDSINNTVRLSDVTPYVDLSSKRENIEAIGLLNLDDNFFAYEYNALYEVILDQVLDPKTIDDTEVVMTGSAMEDMGILVLLTQSGRIIEYDEGQFRFASTEDESWKPGVAIAAYGKYIYMLSPSTNQIYKYSRLRSSYSTATEYNSDAEIQDAISFAIDGNIYVLKKGGEIIQLFKSKKQPFEIEDLTTDISEATKIFTSPELDGLYILDSVNKRVIIVQKDIGLGGRYQGQVYFENLDNVQDIYVEKNENKLYLLTKKEIFEVDI